MSNQTLSTEAPSIQLGEKYEMKRLLATGGAARIFLARQVGLDREVVVKVLRRQLCAKPEFRKHFALEARLLAHLEQPNIVQIIDFGEHEGYFYFVMEYVRGGSLRGLLERVNRLPMDVALSIAHFILRGIAYVHERKVLHLDIKPANILLSSEGIIKVADFGLARLINQTESSLTGRPQAGTPLYMSPEQVLGSKLDERSDIFSLGSLLYQLLTSKTPFLGRSADEVYLKILACRVTPTSAHRPEIPDFIDNLVMTCLQRDRAQRHPNVQALCDEFNTALQKLGIHRPEERVSKYLSDPNQYRTIVKKVSTQKRAARPPRRSRTWLKMILIPLITAALLAMESWILARLPWF